MKKENIVTQFNKVSEELSPANASQIRVWNRIKAGLAKEKVEVKEGSALFGLFSKRRFLIPFLIAPVCFIVIALPLIINSNNSLKQSVDFGYEPETSTVGDVANERDYDSQVIDGKGLYRAPTVSEQEQDNKTKEDDRAKEKTGTISIEVTDFNQKFQELNKILTDMDGYTLETRINSNYEKSGYLKVRVPVERFDEFTGKLREISYEVVSENLSIMDKQNEVVSFESQISEIDKKLENKNLSESERKSLETQKLNLQKQLDSLKKTTAYATLTIHVSENVSFDEQVSSTFDEVSKLLVNVAAFWIKVLIWISVPLLSLSPVLLPLYIVGKKVIRKIKKK